MNGLRLLRTLLAAVAASGAIFGSAALAQQGREISVLMPSLSGPKGLSESVTTIMGLQVWQTLRRTDGGKGPGRDFGRGAVKDAKALPSLTHRTAEELARRETFLSQMVLWGTVQDYGGGAIVEAYLSVPAYARFNDAYFADFRKERKEEWVVRVRAGARQVEFRRDIPRRRIAFEPIVIAPAVVKNYSSYDALQLYDLADPSKPIGPIGNDIWGVEQRGESAIVTTRGVTGIVRLPRLSANRSEVVDFVGGLMRIFRGDWPGAEQLMRAVAENPNAPTEVRVDAYLYRALAMASAR